LVHVVVGACVCGSMGLWEHVVVGA
jgi:hypothetical protein